MCQGKGRSQASGASRDGGSMLGTAVGVWAGCVARCLAAAVGSPDFILRVKEAIGELY